MHPPQSFCDFGLDVYTQNLTHFVRFKTKGLSNYLNVCKKTNTLDIYTSKMNLIFNTYICFDSSQHLALDLNNFVQINFLDILFANIRFPDKCYLFASLLVCTRGVLRWNKHNLIKSIFIHSMQTKLKKKEKSVPKGLVINGDFCPSDSCPSRL